MGKLKIMAGTSPKSVAGDSKMDEQHMPRRYIIAVIAIFLILVLGMVTPDILQFFTQQHQLEALQKNESQSAVSITISNQNGTIIVTNLPCTNGTNATISLSLTN